MVRINAIDSFSEPLEDLRAALAASNVVGTWDWDIARRQVRYDAGAAKLLAGDGDLAGVPLTGAAAIPAVHPEDTVWLRAEIAAALRAGGLIVAEFRVVARDGEARWVLLRGRIYLDELARPVRGHGILIDITETREESRGYFARTAPPSGDPLDRAAELIIDARRAVGQAGGPASLRLILDMALLEAGRGIARRSRS